jgi:hypothetical protein
MFRKKTVKVCRKKICAKHISYIYNFVVQSEALWHAQWHHTVSFLSLFMVEFLVQHNYSGFDGLVVSMLASGTQDRGFAPGRSSLIF